MLDDCDYAAGGGADGADGADFLPDAFDAPPLLIDTMSAEERELLLLVLSDDREHELLPITTGVHMHADADIRDDVHATTPSAVALAPAQQQRVDTTAPHAHLTDSENDHGNENTQRSADATTNGSQSEADSDAPGTPPPPPQTLVKVNPRRNRKRRKHEVDALRIEMRELSEKLERLRNESAAARRAIASADTLSPMSSYGNVRDALVAVHVELPGSGSGSDLHAQSPPAHWIVIKNEKRHAASPPVLGAWESQARIEREATVAAMHENVRLRALYENKLETLRHLEALYSAQQQQQPANFWTGDPLSIPWLQDQSTASAQLSKRARLNPFDPDFAVFASLGRDFDAQYAKADAIFAASGIAHIDGNFKRKMRPTRGANGIYFLESVHSRVHSHSMFEHDERHWDVMSRHDLHIHHGLFEIRELTANTMLRKMVHTIRLPNGVEATLTRRTALKRYIEAHRIVMVWDTALEISGPLSMQLRERGWKIMRVPNVMPPGYSGGPIHVEQSCSRITPELSSTYAAEDIGAGSVTNAVVASYYRHMRWLAHLNREIFFAEFSKMSLSCKHKCPKQRESGLDSLSDCGDGLPSIIAPSEPFASASASGPQPACVS